MTSTEARTEPRIAPQRAPRPWRYVASVAGAAGGALAFGLWLGEGRTRWRLALPDAEWGLSAARLATDLSVVGTLGLLVTAILLRGPDGRLGEPALRCLRAAAWPALAWAVAAVLTLPLTWAEVTRLPLGRLTLGELFNGTSVPEGVPYAFGALLALVIAVAASVTRTARGAAFLLLLAAYNVLPITTRGHGSHTAFTGFSVTVHVIGISLWVGGLAGLLFAARRSPDLLALAVPRFSRLALVCYTAVAVSGLTTAWVVLGSLDQLWTSRYGLLLMFKAAALLSLGVFGRWHRAGTVPAVVRRRPRAFLRLAAAEVAVMAIALGFGAALSRAPTPAPPAAPMRHAAPVSDMRR